MYSSEDLERFYFQYQTEAMPKGISIDQFCSRNKVPYNIFYKWYKDTHNKIVEVNVDGVPTSAQGESKQENQKIRSQKKQFRNVIFLFLILILCCIGLYFLYDNLTNTKDQLYDANGTIHRQTQVIQKKKEKISYLNNTITSLQGQLENEKNERLNIERKLEKVCSSYPFIVTNCTVSSTEFSFDYYTSEEKEITVTLKAVNDRNSEVVTNTHTDTYYKGGGHKSFSFSYSLNSSYYYYVVLIYDGQIIAGKRW